MKYYFPKMHCLIIFILLVLTGCSACGPEIADRANADALPVTIRVFQERPRFHNDRILVRFYHIDESFLPLDKSSYPPQSLLTALTVLQSWPTNYPVQLKCFHQGDMILVEIEYRGKYPPDRLGLHVWQKELVLGDDIDIHLDWYPQMPTAGSEDMGHGQLDRELRVTIKPGSGPLF